MGTVWIVIMAILLVALGVARWYFTLGPGRHITVGNKDRWWNQRVRGPGRYSEHDNSGEDR